MVDFVDITEDNYWPRLPGPYMITGELNSVDYIQDILKSDGIQRKKVDDSQDRSHVHPYEYVDATQESLIWPAKAIEHRTIGPYVVAAALAFFIVPMVDPSIGIGASLATGYVGGMAEYYVEAKSTKRAPKKPRPFFKQEISVATNTDLYFNLPHHYPNLSPEALAVLTRKRM